MTAKWSTLVSLTLQDFFRTNSSYMAAGIAYWVLFSLFPLALAATSILGFAYSTPERQATLIEARRRRVSVVPVSSDYLSDLIKDVVRGRDALGVFAIVALLWTGTAVFSAVRQGINHAWQVRRPYYFLVERAIDLAMLAGVALLALLLVLLATGSFGLTQVTRALGGDVVVRFLVDALGLALTLGAFLLLYRYVPNTRVAWGDVWLGAVVGALLFHLVRTGFVSFVGRFAEFNLVYGSLGAVMAILMWAYLSALAIVFGAQISHSYSRVFGSRAGAAPEAQGLESEAVGESASKGLVATMLGWLLPPRRRRP